MQAYRRPEQAATTRQAVTIAIMPGQPAVRPPGMFSGGIKGMKVKTTYLQMFALGGFIS